MHIANRIAPELYQLQSLRSEVYICYTYIYVYVPMLYISNTVCACAGSFHSATRLRPIFPSRKGNAVPSLAGMCAGINAHRGGFLAYHCMDDYAMPGLMRRGIENAEKLYSGLASRGWSAGLRWVPERNEGQECILKGTGVFRSRADGRMYRVVCLFVQGRHCVPGAVSNACHDFLPVTRPVLLL